MSNAASTLLPFLATMLPFVATKSNIASTMLPIASTLLLVWTGPKLYKIQATAQRRDGLYFYISRQMHNSMKEEWRVVCTLSNGDRPIGNDAERP